MAGSKFEQDRRGDVVGKVSGNAQPLTGVRSGDRKVECKDVLLDDVHPLRIRLRLQGSGEFAVKLDSYDLSGASGENLGDCACARADFDDGSRPKVTERSDDPVRGLHVNEEVLPEPGFLLHLLLPMVDEAGCWRTKRAIVRKIRCNKMLIAAYT